jgi:hypothetical protein
MFRYPKVQTHHTSNHLAHQTPEGRSAVRPMQDSCLAPARQPRFCPLSHRAVRTVGVKSRTRIEADISKIVRKYKPT